jgi:hypothetical protein
LGENKLKREVTFLKTTKDFGGGKSNRLINDRQKNIKHLETITKKKIVKE